MEEDEEARLAEAPGDPTFQPGETQRRYIHGQVLKHNVDGTDEGRLTLRRNGAGFDDVTTARGRHAAAARDKEMVAFAEAVIRQWDTGRPMQLSGAHGVHEHRERLGRPWDGMAKSKIRTLAKARVTAGLLATAPQHPAHPGAKQARWLRPPHSAAQEDKHVLTGAETA